MRKICILLGLVCVLDLGAVAPYYSDLHRRQSTTHRPDPDKLLRIWVVYIGQGDGLLIQLPPSANYQRQGRPEPIDVLIDGGSFYGGNAGLMGEFMKRLYPGRKPVIEHAVLTHNDSDHIRGLTKLLQSGPASFGHVYHNGLAQWKPGKRGLPATQTKAFKKRAVRESNRIMGTLSQGVFDSRYVVDDLRTLTNAYRSGELQGVYRSMAKAAEKRGRKGQLLSFNRVRIGAPFIDEKETRAQGGVKFTPLWPNRQLREFGGRNWGETVNGNSVTFRLDYGDFSMVFTGDHNEHSEAALVAHYKAQKRLDLLKCDVLKVPHHGSSHGIEDFFTNCAPIMSVASQGRRGFIEGWKHPSTKVIRWLGGHHRVYHTFVRERAFDYHRFTSAAKHEAMIEKSHILVETDGQYFRVVEVPLDLSNVPTIQATVRSDGTRWISARERTNP